MQQAFSQLHKASRNLLFPELKLRRHWLAQLKALILENEQAIVAAIAADFSERSSFEAQLAEIYPSVKAIKFAQKQLARWMQPEKRKVDIWLKPASAKIIYQPLGVAGIIVPWNYPLYMAVGPMVSALSAGNRVMLKMSEFTPEFGKLFQTLITKYFPQDVVQVINGDAKVGAEFAALAFDHLLFTGSTEVGKKIMKAASDNLTPVTLELGGKSPTIVDKGYSITKAAERIMFGKLLNAGQTCLAPDYVLVHESQQAEFIEACKAVSQKFHPEWNNPNFTAINSPKQFERQQVLLKDAKEKGAKIVHLHSQDKTSTSGRKMAPTLMLETTKDMLVRQEEIFGPSMLVISYQELGEAIDFVNNNPRPLALYLFSDSQKNIGKVLMQSISGGVTINDTVLHISQESLPFGGIGPSGMGHYHGFDGFKTFSQTRSVFKQKHFASTFLMYPPYGKLARFIYKLMRGR